MGNRGIKNSKMKKRNIIIKILASMLIFTIVILGYAYWQYQHALTESTRDLELDSQPEIEFAGEADQFGNVNVLLMGVDSRGEEHSRADSIMILQYDQETKTPKMVSIMRDSYVDIPGYGMNKINAAAAFGGPELLRKTIKTNFDVDIKYYAQIDFEGFKKMIDKTFPDGVEVDVEKGMSKNIGVSLAQGKQLLNGKELLGYVRFRSDAESDFGRVQRQQKVLHILADEIISFRGLTQFPEIIGTIQPYIDTNVEKKLLLAVLTSYFQNKNTIDNLRIPIDDGYKDERVMIGKDRAAVLVLDLELNRQALKEFLNG